MNDLSPYPNLDECNPQVCISGRMMRCNRIIASVFRKHLRGFGITNSQLSIIFFASKAGSITQAELSEWLFMEKSTVSRNMRRLLEKGIINKNASQKIVTTAKGKRLLEKVIPNWNAAMKEARQMLGKDGEEALNSIVANLTSSVLAPNVETKTEK